MNILIVTTHLNFGGISSYAVSLAKQLKQKGHKVYIASSGGDMTKELEASEIKHLSIPLTTKSELSPKVLISAIKILKILKSKKIDIMHAQTRVSQVSCCIASVLSSIPYVTTCHGFFKPKFTRKIFQFWGAKVIAISEAVRAHLVNDLQVAKNKIVLIHNGVDINNFQRNYTLKEKDEIKKEFNLNSGLTIGIIARLSSVKGHKYLIKAAELLLKENEKVQFLIIGDGPEKEKLIKLSRELGVIDKIIFHKSVLDTARPLSIMDIFVMPSVSEGLGLSILEAMASGLPIVASNVGGIYSLVKEGDNGVLVDPKNPGSLKKAMKVLLDNKQIRMDMGKKSLKRCEADFSLELFADDVEKLYSQTLMKKKS
jgi:glycosyltransferase involved in cell wall biosynthesis